MACLNRSRPKANAPIIIPHELVDKTKRMLEQFGQIPLPAFGMFWQIKYDEIIDFVDMGYNGGLSGFLRDNGHLFTLTKEECYWYVKVKSSIKSDPISEGCEATSSLAILKPALFNPSVFLWHNQPWACYLDKGPYHIPKSAYETALMYKFQETQSMTNHIRDILKRHPDGMPLSSLYKFIPVKRVLEMFSVSISISALVDELPELFYRKRYVDGQDDLIFDACTHTLGDLTGKSDTHFETGKLTPESIATKAVNEGLYQMTLLLIRQAGIEKGRERGLKINVWRKAIRTNFLSHLNDNEFDYKMYKLDTMRFFMALARYDIIKLDSHQDCKNDILAFLPRVEVNYMQLKVSLNDLNFDNNSESGSDQQVDFKML